MPQVRILSPGPHKNESYDTKGIATFVLFFLSKMPVAQGFLSVGHKRICIHALPCNRAWSAHNTGIGTIMSLAVAVPVLLTVGIIIFADRSNQQIVLRTYP